MKYSIDITGIHCSGCLNLIKFCLEEAGLKNIIVNKEDNQAEFETNKNINEVEEMLSTVFNNDLQNYKYTNLIVKN